MKDLSVWLERIALCFPGRQSTFEELDPGKMHRQSSMQYCPAGFLTRRFAASSRNCGGGGANGEYRTRGGAAPA